MSFERYLKENGFEEKAIDCVCPHCVTVADFITTHPKGKYLLMCQCFVVPIMDGICFDSKNRLNEIVLYYYEGGK